MSQPNRNPCIQKRIKKWVRKNRWFLAKMLFAIGVIIIFVLEVFGFRVLESFAQVMRDLENMFPEAFKGVATFLSGAFSFVLGRYFYDRYRKPKLEILRANELVTLDHKWWRVIVKNIGKTAAENCTGSIHLSGMDANGNNIDEKGSVCWSILGNPNAITINVEDEQSLDVYRILSVKRSFLVEFPTEKGWEYIRDIRFEEGILSLDRFADPANLKIEIRITAKNTKPTEKTYSLRRQQNDAVMIESS